MLRFAVNASITDTMPVGCSPDVPISLACLFEVGGGPDRGIVGTASPRDLEGPRWQTGWRPCPWSKRSFTCDLLGL